MTTLFSYNSPWWQWTNRLLHLLWLNILWLVCSLPLVTVGASTTALYAVTLSYAKHEDGYLTKEFFQAFRENFRQSTLVFLLSTGVGLLLGVDVILYIRTSQANWGSFILLLVFFTSVLIYIFVNLYVYAIMATFENSTFHCLKNALLMSIYHWPTSVLMIFIGVLIVGIGFFLFPPLLFFGFALFCYLCSLCLQRVFARHMA